MDLKQLVDPQSPIACSSAKIAAVQKAIEGNVLDADTTFVMLYDLQRFRSDIALLKEAFPQPFFTHTMAVKANPVLNLMKLALKEGLGFEAASFGELKQALNAESPPSKIVFDSPVKTLNELKFSLEKGIYVNLDNLQELERVAQLVATNHYPQVNVGIRVNPQVGVGGIKDFSTGGKVSKFGVAMSDYETELFEAYKKYDWLNGIHIHVGSQGCPVDLIISGIRRIFDIVAIINKNSQRQQIQFVDIGGGYPVNFNDESNVSAVVPPIKEYAKMLQDKVPELFSGDYRIITEFGRIYNAKSGFFVSRVEYTKQSGEKNIALVHCGSDLFVRTVWAPTVWAIRMTVLNSKGEVKQGNRIVQDIAGPCCHGGDIIAHSRELPLIEQGDYIIAHDTGAYYYSTYSYYNSRQAPAIYGFEVNDGMVSFTLLKPAASVEQTLSFFS